MTYFLLAVLIVLLLVLCLVLLFKKRLGPNRTEGSRTP